MKYSKYINYVQQYLYLKITNYSKTILHLQQRNLVAQYPLSLILILKVLVPGGKIVLFIGKYIKWISPDLITVFHQL